MLVQRVFPADFKYEPTDVSVSEIISEIGFLHVQHEVWECILRNFASRTLAHPQNPSILLMCALPRTNSSAEWLTRKWP